MCTSVPNSAAVFPELDAPLNSLVRRLERAERYRSPRAAGIAASVVSELMDRGRYRLGSSWAEWSIHLHEMWHARGAASYFASIRQWALAKLVLGQPDELERRWGKGLARIPAGLAGCRTFLEGLGCLITLRNGEAEEAADRCDALWKRAQQRSDLADIANPFVQSLLRLGRAREARSVAERLAALSVHADAHGRALCQLVAGIALSEDNPAQGCILLENARRALTGAWRAQAACFLAQAHRLGGRVGIADSVLAECAADIQEISPVGLGLLMAGADGPEQSRAAEPAARLELRFLGGLEVTHRGRVQAIRLRFAEILAVLARHPKGMTAEQLALAIYGEEGNPACCKTELSRLKQLVPIENRPYHIGVPVRADFLELEALICKGALREAIELYRGPLLPRSDAPEISDLRTVLEESLRTAVVATRDAELMWDLAGRIHDDLELWESVHERLPAADPRRALAQAQVSSLQRSWAS